ncbi:MAG: hypothetical protein JJT94_01220 [Bernardetiaceae bacterium]|nr:hypothetical protein [Bernardetiaceae bacterium]
MLLYLPFALVFGLSTLLPIYLLRIRAKYKFFWLNTLPMLLASFVASAVHAHYWREQYSGFWGLLTYFTVFAIVMALNVAIIVLTYRIIFGEKPHF